MRDAPESDTESNSWVGDIYLKAELIAAVIRGGRGRQNRPVSLLSSYSIRQQGILVVPVNEPEDIDEACRWPQKCLTMNLSVEPPSTVPI